jgi:hypothetical protein
LRGYDESEKLKRSSIVVIVLVILAGIGLASCFTLASFDVFVPKYMLHLTEPLNDVNYYCLANGTQVFYTRGVLVVFNQDNRTAAKCFLGETGYSTEAPTENVTLAEGPYTVNVYDATSGVFMQKLDIYVADETSLTLGAYSALAS